MELFSLKNKYALDNSIHKIDFSSLKFLETITHAT